MSLSRQNLKIMRKLEGLQNIIMNNATKKIIMNYYRILNNNLSPLLANITSETKVSTLQPRIPNFVSGIRAKLIG